MNKLFSIVFQEDHLPLVYDYRNKIVTWKRMSHRKVQFLITAMAIQGHIVVKGDGRHGYGDEIHIVPRIEYDRTIEKQGKVK